MSGDNTLRELRALDARSLQLQVVQPGLIGLIDGTISTLAPIFADTYAAAKIGASVEIVPSIRPIRPGCTTCSCSERASSARSSRKVLSPLMATSLELSESITN